MEKRVFMLSGILLGISLPAAVGAFVRCNRCDDVLSPSDCQLTVLCGQGEICYAREYKNNLGQKGFHLGCEADARCSLFFNAQHILGKRAGAIPDPNMCYECCHEDLCNSNLCKGVQGVSIPQPSTTTTVISNASCPQPTTNLPCICAPCPSATHQTDSGFPYLSAAYKDRYYYVSTIIDTWVNARAFCKKYGGDLVSINTQDEQEFLVQQLKLINIKNIDRFWIGGAYIPALGEWEWVDFSPVTYKDWQSGYPVSPLGHRYDYHIVMNNPVYSDDMGFTEGRWTHDPIDTYGRSGDAPYACICEKQRN